MALSLNQNPTYDPVASEEIPMEKTSTVESAKTNSITDEVIEEIGNQLFLKLKNSRFKSTKFLSIKDSISVYERQIDLLQLDIETIQKLNASRTTKDGNPSKLTPDKQKGFDFEDLHVDRLNREGKQAKTTDQPGKPKDTVTDVVEVTGDKKLIKSQLKNYDDPKELIYELAKNPKYLKNQQIVVPKDKYQEVSEELEKQIEKETDPDQKSKYRKIKNRLRGSELTTDQTKHPYQTKASDTVKDATRVATEVTERAAAATLSHVVALAVGGAAWELRDYYKNPNEVSALDRLKRFLLTIWEHLKSIFNRELASETLQVVLAGLMKPLNIAMTTISRLHELLFRLWNEFTAKKIRSLSDLIALALKAAYVLFAASLTLMLDQYLSTAFQGIPLIGDILAMVISAVLAGIMVVLGCRGIENVVTTLFGIFRAAELARKRREEIERICREAIPKLIEDREQLQQLISEDFMKREETIQMSFDELRESFDDDNTVQFVDSLIKLNAEYGQVLPWQNTEQFRDFMKDPKQTLTL